MKQTTMLIALIFTSLPLFANPLKLQCSFLPRTKLQDFTVSLQETSAKIAFKGVMDLNEDLNPSGEKVTLEVFESNGWVHLNGTEVVKTNSPCSYFVNGECAAPARGFELNLPKASLDSADQIEGSLNFSKMSDYLPAEAFYSHSVTCVRK